MVYGRYDGDRLLHKARAQKRIRKEDPHLCVCVKAANGWPGVRAMAGMGVILPGRAKSESTIAYSRKREGGETDAPPKLEDFRCSMCYQHLCEPVTFRCGLSCCEVCAASWADKMLAEDPEMPGLRCPLGCGAEHEIALPRVSVTLRQQVQAALGETVYAEMTVSRRPAGGAEAALCLRMRTALQALQQKAQPAEEVRMWKAAYIGLTREMAQREAVWQHYAQEQLATSEEAVAQMRRQLNKKPFLTLQLRFWFVHLKLELLGFVQRTLACLACLPIIALGCCGVYAVIGATIYAVWAFAAVGGFLFLLAVRGAARYINPTATDHIEGLVLIATDGVEVKLMLAAMSGALAFGAISWGYRQAVHLSDWLTRTSNRLGLFISTAVGETRDTTPPPASIVVQGAGSPAANGTYTHTPGDKFGDCALYKKDPLWLLRYRMPHTGNHFWYIADKNNLHNDPGDLYRCRARQTDTLPPVDGWTLAVDGLEPPPTLEFRYV
jgi:hypothetical protein